MANEHVRDLTDQYRASAESKGDAALEAIRSGDIGRARAAAREAAQCAWMVIQLEDSNTEEGRTETVSETKSSSMKNG